MNQELSIQYMYTVRISDSQNFFTQILITNFSHSGDWICTANPIQKKKKTPFFDTKGKNDSRNLNKMWDLIPESGRYFT